MWRTLEIFRRKKDEDRFLFGGGLADRDCCDVQPRLSTSSTGPSASSPMTPARSAVSEDSGANSPHRTETSREGSASDAGDASAEEEEEEENYEGGDVGALDLEASGPPVELAASKRVRAASKVQKLRAELAAAEAEIRRLKTLRVEADVVAGAVDLPSSHGHQDVEAQEYDDDVALHRVHSQGSEDVSPVTASPQHRPGFLASRVRSLAGWTLSAGRAAVRELEAAIAELEETSGSAECGPPAGKTSPEASQSADEGEEEEPPSREALEVRNEPFYAVVRKSIDDALQAQRAKVSENGSSNELVLTDSPDEEVFEQWLRQFHSERDDVWYAKNYTRVYNAFRPHWDEVLAARRAHGQTLV